MLSDYQKSLELYVAHLVVTVPMPHVKTTQGSCTGERHGEGVKDTAQDMLHAHSIG